MERRRRRKAGNMVGFGTRRGAASRAAAMIEKYPDV